MEKIPTAEEWFSDKFQLEIYSRKLTQEEKGIEFAKLHVTEVLKQASEAVDDHSVQVGMHYAEYDGLLDSIINAYPLENIK